MWRPEDVAHGSGEASGMVRVAIRMEFLVTGPWPLLQAGSTTRRAIAEDLRARLAQELRPGDPIPTPQTGTPAVEGADEPEDAPRNGELEDHGPADLHDHHWSDQGL